MPRGPRVSYPHAIFHVINRFVDRHPFFRSRADYRLFLDMYFETARAFGMLTFAWCLMPNHFHLILETPSGDISEFLRRFLTRVARELNRRHLRNGHLFQGRSKTLLIETDPYFETVIGYVLLNPVRADICARPTDYEWSSAAEMLMPAVQRVERRILAERIMRREYAPHESEEQVADLRTWLSNLNALQNRDEFVGAHRGAFLSSHRFRKNVLLQQERRIRFEGSQLRRKTDRPTAEWTWEQMGEIANEAAEHARSRCLLTAWAGPQFAAQELRVWLAHQAARWPYTRIRQADGNRLRLGSYGVIVSRIRSVSAKRRVADELLARRES